mgnify:FL=1
MPEASPTPPIDAAPARPWWGPLALAIFVGLVVCTNIAAASWAKLLDQPEQLLALSSRNRYLVLALGADVSTAGYWLIGGARIAFAFLVCHMIGRAYADTALTWFVKYLGVTQDSLDQFNRIFSRVEWVLIPFFAGSNLVAALSGVHRTPIVRVVALLAVGIVARLALIRWLASVFPSELESLVDWLNRYSWWFFGLSIVVVVLFNVRNFRRGSTR